MSRPVTSLLILLVALTSIALGAARGTVRMGDEVVLCSGHGVVVTRLPAGQGEDRAYVCPDMALMLLAALLVVAAAALQRPSPSQAKPPQKFRPAAPAYLSSPRARGPPDVLLPAFA